MNPDNTCDLCDLHKGDHSGAFRVLPPVFQAYGGRPAFAGPVSTVKCHEDNTSVKTAVESPGQGRVLVVDGGGSLRHALVGGNLAAAAARRLRQVTAAPGHQHRIFSRLTRRLAATSHWAEAGVTATMNYPRFQERIAPHSYERLAPAVERMKRGEADVLWPGRCAHFAVSSGTTAGRTKFLPVTPDLLGGPCPDDFS